MVVPILFIREGVHLVRRRREDERLGGTARDDPLGQLLSMSEWTLGSRVGEQVLEALELVEDDEVRCQHLHGHIRHGHTQTADDRAARTPVVVAPPRSAGPSRLVRQQIFHQGPTVRARLGTEVLLEAGQKSRVQVRPALPPSQSLPKPLHSDAHRQVAGPAVLAHLLLPEDLTQHPVQQGSFPRHPGGVPQIQRGPWGEGHELQPLATGRAHGGRQHGEPVGVVLELSAGEISESAEVLAGDLSVGADVHQGDGSLLVPQVVDRSRGDPLGDQGLAQPDFIGDQETVHTVLVRPEPPKRVLHGGPLERFEAVQDLVEVRPALSHG